MKGNTGNKSLTVVLVDDDPAHLELIEHSLNHIATPACPISVKSYTDADEALVELPPSGRVVILCDNRLGVTSGLEWLPDFVRADVGPVIIMTSSGDEKIAAEAFHRGASDYLDKSIIFEQPDRFWNTIREALRRFKLDHTNRDLSRNLKIANRQLEDRNRRLNEMTETAHQFVDNVAHEFRTPLTVIREFNSILADGIGGELNNEQLGFLGYIDAAARDLSQMVDDFLDSSKLKARTLRVDRHAAEVGAIMEKVWPILETRANEKSIELACQIEPNLPQVFCDIEKVGRIIINLVVNAVKFSHEGGKVDIHAHATGNGDIEIAITDHGIGIPPEELERLGERFRQAGDPRQESGKGFGLGLNIARNLVWLNFGEMSISSTIHEGSTCAFTLPNCDPEHILHQYARQIAASDTAAEIAVLRIQPVHAQADAESVRSVLCDACQSLDLLLPSTDGRTLMVMGPSESPDRWIQRLNEAWQQHAPSGMSQSTLMAEWIGSWPPHQLKDAVAPIVLRSLMGGKRCA